MMMAGMRSLPFHILSVPICLSIYLCIYLSIYLYLSLVMHLKKQSSSTDDVGPRHERRQVCICPPDGRHCSSRWGASSDSGGRR